MITDENESKAPNSSKGKAPSPAHPQEPETILSADKKTQLQALITSYLQMDRPQNLLSIKDDFFCDIGLSVAQVNALCQKLRAEKPQYSGLSIRDVIANSSIASLADFLITFEQPAASTQEQATTAATSYFLCGFAQATTFTLLLTAISTALATYLPWVYSSATFSEAFLRSTCLSAVWVVLGTCIPVALKWSIIGRWQEESFPLWGTKYFRFWLVKGALRFSPLGWFPGTPLYNTYLRLLGARIAPSAVLHLDSLPVCTDLLSVGANTIVQSGTSIDCHKAVSGRMITGNVSLSDNVSVGHGSRLDLDTAIADGASLAHCATLLQGSKVPAGEFWHGSPAHPATPRGKTAHATKNRFVARASFSLAVLTLSFILPAALLSAVYTTIAQNVSSTSSFADAFSWLWVRQSIFVASCIGITFLLMSIFTSIWLPRVLRPLIQPGQTYPRYGIHHLTYTLNKYLSNALPLHRALGDSIYIDDYLQSVGYRFDERRRSGLHFGLYLQNDAAHLNNVASGVQAGTHLSMLNAVETAGTFELRENTLPPDTELGAHINLPSNHCVGQGCRIAGFTMIPTEGVPLEKSKLLGSPTIVLPYKQTPLADLINRRAVMLPAKNRHNLVTVLLYLASVLFSIAITVMSFSHDNIQAAQQPWFWASSILMALTGVSAWHLIIEKMNQPRSGDSLLHPYDPDYWREERSQKLKSSLLDRLFTGTPLRSGVLRARGVTVGQYLYDEGFSCSELSRLSIADHCTINRDCRLQTNSEHRENLTPLPISLGNQVTLQPGCVLNGGTQVDARADVACNAVLLSGEKLGFRSIWSGNPAAPVAATPAQ